MPLPSSTTTRRSLAHPIRPERALCELTVADLLDLVTGAIHTLLSDSFYGCQYPRHIAS